MKIALVSQEYPPETARGGIGTQTYLKAKGLSGLGHDVFVISRSTDSRRHESVDGNLCVIRIPGMEDDLPSMTDIVQWITHCTVIAAEIESLNKRVELDIIDFPEWAAEGYVYLLNRTEWNSVPTVIQLHGPLVMLAHTINYPDLDSEFYRVGTHMEAKCVQLADAVYSSSACSTQWIRKYYKPKQENIPTIHLGVDTALFAPGLAGKSEHPTIIFTGKIVQNKGVEELVEAAGNLVWDFPNLRLRLIGGGRGEFIKRLQERARRLSEVEFLEFPGFIKRDQLPNELCRADIFASPSYYEGGPGFVFLEAMSCGLPVVGCSGSGVDEIVVNGENGILIPPKDSTSLEMALRELLSNQGRRVKMGENARNLVLRESDSDFCLKKLESFYQSVVRRN